MTGILSKFRVGRGKRSAEIESENRADSCHVAGIPSDEHSPGFAATDLSDRIDLESGKLLCAFEELPAERNHVERYFDSLALGGGS